MVLPRTTTNSLPPPDDGAELLPLIPDVGGTLDRRNADCIVGADVSVPFQPLGCRREVLLDLLQVAVGQVAPQRYPVETSVDQKGQRGEDDEGC